MTSRTLKILVHAGETVHVGDVVGRIVEEGEAEEPEKEPEPEKERGEDRGPADQARTLSTAPTNSGPRHSLRFIPRS